MIESTGTPNLEQPKSSAPCGLREALGYVAGPFLSAEQKAVVEYRISSGYECSIQSNGYWFCHKGKHRMLINACGHDCFVGVL